METEMNMEKYSTRSDYVDTGLNNEEILQSALVHGKNNFTKPKQKSELHKFTTKFFQPFNVLLLIASILSFFLYLIESERSNLYLGLCIFIVSVLNTLLEYLQERKTAAILESFQKLVPAECLVMRNGNYVRILAHELVEGDIIHLKMGDKVGADIKLIETKDLKIDESSLTGESEPISKKACSVTTRNKSDVNGECDVKNELDESRKCDIEECDVNEEHDTDRDMAYSGNFVVNGEGKGIVVAIGDNTVLGKIAHLSVSKKATKSELTQEIEQYVKRLSLVALFTSIIFYYISVKNGFSLRDNLVFCVGIFIAFVPQGLPAAVTILMTVAVKKMAKMNVMVKDLKAVETLGSISLLATDKTGTLTQGKMKCVNFWDGKSTHNLLESKYNIPKSIYDALKCCLRVKTSEKEQIIGDPTEVALYTFYNDLQQVYDKKTETEPRILCDIPFNSESKWQISVTEENDTYKITLKGAPEKVYNICNEKEKDYNKFNEKYEEFAAEGQRVIALAEKTYTKEEFYNKDETGNVFEIDGVEIKKKIENFNFLGLIGIVDPPKDGVKDAIMKLRIAGIQVVMITGDHPLTAEYIARKVYIVSGDKRTIVGFNETQNEDYEVEIITGDTLDDLTDNDWERILSKKEIVFARISPKQKLTIVEKFQEAGHIVGVSGDGVNDAPALKKAHLGISMNKTGNEVSKEAASMILMDDNFGSIVNGVMEGRKIFTNLKKSIRYILSHITPQIIPFLLFVSFGVPSPMSSILLMFIDLFTESLPAVFLAFEPAEGNVMIEMPRKMPRKAVKKSIENEDTHFSSLIVIKTWFNSIFMNNQGESLCDLDLLLWSYFEAGTFITLGALASFFATLYLEGVPHHYFTMSSQFFFKNNANSMVTQSGTTLNHQQQLEILYKAQSAYFYSILIGQSFNIITCKRKSVLASGRTFYNRLPIYGSIISLLIGYCILNISKLNDVLFSRSVHPIVCVFPVLSGLLLLVWDFSRKKLKRKLSFFRRGDIDVVYRLRRSKFVEQRHNL
ncbi:hypothetical protein BDAP_001263 [Binucleata daphniae]